MSVQTSPQETLPHYLRSTHINRDFSDPQVLDHYLMTPQTQAAWRRIRQGLVPGSHDRAWRITGDYGSGKSSFAVFIAQALSRPFEQMPEHVFIALEEQSHLPTPSLLPVLMTCVQEPLAVTLVSALHDALAPHSQILPLKQLRSRLRTLLIHSERITDTLALAMVHELLEASVAAHVAGGMLIIMDELGKSLEYAAMNPHHQDVYLLQRLAEAAARSADQPLLVLGILHQGFHAYTDLLAHTTQREWDKVAGRFEEIVFQQTIESVAGLVVDALQVNTALLPSSLQTVLTHDMDSLYHLQWYGNQVSQTQLRHYAGGMYPLHPTVLPVLIQLFTRFGQNERSLFGFLFSHDPYGLQTFLAEHSSEATLYCLHHLYDYVQATFGTRMGQQGYRYHWHLIEGIIASYPENATLAVCLLKTIGLLNVIDTSPLFPTQEVLEFALPLYTDREVKQALDLLHHQKSLLHLRGRSNGYCLWPYTSVNLDSVYEAARQVIEPHSTISQRILPFVENRSLVARRHYIQTGTLRYFEVEYVPLADLLHAAQTPSKVAAGKIVVPLCETEADCEQAQVLASTFDVRMDMLVLCAISHPLTDLAGLIHEVECWQWVSDNTPELVHDTYGAEEVQRKLTLARDTLETRLQQSIGLRNSYGPFEVRWYHRGQPVIIPTRRHLLAYLSDLCDQQYADAPTIINELINRDTLSSAAAAARSKLIELLLNHSEESCLGMNPQGSPPEMSLYLSVCRETGLHQQRQQQWAFALPEPENDTCSVRPVFERIHQFLADYPDQHVAIDTIFTVLRNPPFGVREGLIPLIFAIYWVMYRQELALFENGTFLRDVQELDFRRLLKWPGTFAVQLSHMTEAHERIIVHLAQVLIAPGTTASPITLIDLVRHLMHQVTRLPEYTRKTHTLSPTTRRVFIALKEAKDPAQLMFYDLPKACGFDTLMQETSTDIQAHHYAGTLLAMIEELQQSYPKMLEQFRAVVYEGFGYAGYSSASREQLELRIKQVVPSIHEARLKTFCVRVSDRHLADQAWVESLGSFVQSKVPTQWTDEDVHRAFQETRVLTERYRRVETLHFSQVAFADAALKITMTFADGTERDWITFTAPEDEAEVAALEEHLLLVLKHSRKLGVAAAARAVWHLMEHPEE